MATHTVIADDGERIKSFLGTPAALLNCTGIDAAALPELVTPGATCPAIGLDGLAWTLKSDYPLISASRALTAAEKIANVEDEERRTVADFFTLDRLRLCRFVALEVMRLGDAMHPDRPPKRAKRRELRKRLDELAVIQFELMQYRSADVRSARQRLNNMNVIGAGEVT